MCTVCGCRSTLQSSATGGTAAAEASAMRKQSSTMALRYHLRANREWREREGF